ncbi:MAG TPA: DUF4351 domain-containing protein [Firmicutes bacterium]|nr:DUF4351 domain-containing protein [Bacillota bacterium]
MAEKNRRERIQHDRLFKLLLESFFPSFLQAFFPVLHEQADWGDWRFLQQELAGAVEGSTGGPGHETTRVVDVLVEARLRDGENAAAAFLTPATAATVTAPVTAARTHGHRRLLIHVEVQCHRQPAEEFSERMWQYYVAIRRRHGRGILPIAVFAYPSRSETAGQPHQAKQEAQAESELKTERSGEVGWCGLEDLVLGKSILCFQYATIWLNRLDWQRYADLVNPVTVALLPFMRHRPDEAWQLAVAFRRTLAELYRRRQVEPEKLRFLAHFFSAYLPLTPEQEHRVQAALNKRYPEEAKALEEFITPWHEEGLAVGLARGRREGLVEGLGRGVQKGRQTLVLHLIRKRFGRIPPGVRQAVQALSARSLLELGAALLDMSSLEELNSWLKAHEN